LEPGSTQLGYRRISVQKSSLVSKDRNQRFYRGKFNQSKIASYPS
jgi:hypothetical protein